MLTAGDRLLIANCLLPIKKMRFLTKNIRWLLFVCIVAASGIVAALLYGYADISNYQAWKEANVFWVVVGTIAIIAFWAVNAYPTKVGIILYACLLGIIAGFITAYADLSLLRLWAGNDRKLVFFAERTYPDRLIISFGIMIPLTLITAMNRKLVAMKERFAHHTGAESLLKEAELFKLRQQLQPHFLYNSLNAINSLVIIDPDKAQEMVGRLSDFLRASVKKDTNEVQPVADELSYLEDYLAIEAVRFGDRLKIVYEKDYTDHAKMPPFLLQPLIENAIKFGLYGQTGSVTITIRIYLEHNFLILQISNPYDASMQPQKGTGFGLEGIRRRLYLLYSRDDLVQTSSEGNQFITTLKIPQLHV